MFYNVTKINAQVVPQGKQNAGQKYVVVTLEEPEDGETREVPVFDKEAERYLAFIPVANGGTATQAYNIPQDLPDNLKQWKNCFDVEFTFPELMVRVNAEGQPELNKKGFMYQRSSVVVMIRKKRDNETGELVIRKGWDLASRGTSVMNAFYAPARLYNGDNASPSANGNDEVPV